MKLGLRRKKAAKPWKPTLHTSPPSGDTPALPLRNAPPPARCAPAGRPRAAAARSQGKSIIRPFPLLPLFSLLPRFSLPSVPSAPSAPFLPGDHKGDSVFWTMRKTERPLRQPQVFGDGLRPTMERHRRPPGKLVHDWNGVLSHLAISCLARAESTSTPRR